MDPTLSPETLSKLYRFALLLAGDPPSAESNLARIFQEFSSQIDQFRTEKHRTAFLVAKIREQSAAKALATPPPHEESSATAASPAEAAGAIRCFRLLGEPSRSAMALFYLNLFPVSELASLFNVDLEELGGLLRSGREQLKARMSQMSQTGGAEEPK